MFLRKKNVLIFLCLSVPLFYSIESGCAGEKRIPDLTIELAGGSSHLYTDRYSQSDYNAILGLGLTYGRSWHVTGAFIAQRIYEHEQHYTDVHANDLGIFRPNLNMYSMEIAGGYRFSAFRKFSPYVRLGFGVSRRSYENDFIKTIYRDNKAGFAAYAGLHYSITGRIGLSVAGRYYVTNKTVLDNNWKYLFDAGRRQLGVLGGLTFAL